MYTQDQPTFLGPKCTKQKAGKGGRSGCWWYGRHSL